MKAKHFFLCGIAASVLHIAMNSMIPMLYDGYSALSFTVSELSAIGAPTRSLWLYLIVIYSALIFAFGWGVWKYAHEKKSLRIAGILLMANAIFGLFWPPMHTREVIAAGGGTLTDTLHIVWTAVSVPVMLMQMGFGAAAFGKTFRLYSILSILIMLGCGIMTGVYSPAMEQNLPTPWMGLWERFSIAAYTVWILVFAIKLLKREVAHISLFTTHSVAS